MDPHSMEDCRVNLHYLCPVKVLRPIQPQLKVLANAISLGNRFSDRRLSNSFIAVVRQLSISSLG